MRAMDVMMVIDNFMSGFEGIVLTRGDVEELGKSYGFAHALNHCRTYVRIEVDSYNFKTYIVAETIMQCPGVFQTFGHSEKAIAFDMGAGLDKVKSYLSDILPAYGIYRKEDEE